MSRELDKTIIRLEYRRMKYVIREAPFSYTAAGRLIDFVVGSLLVTPGEATRCWIRDRDVAGHLRECGQARRMADIHSSKTS
jgi:hypothetical protein